MHTLLARRLAAGRFADNTAERHAVEDLWRDPLVNQRWQRLALRLTADDCDRIARQAAGKGLAGAGVRWLPTDSATEGWALESGGYDVAAPRSTATAIWPPQKCAPVRMAMPLAHSSQPRAVDRSHA
jgi:hypothetical protein